MNRLPDYVYFDHAVHINNGIGCSTCHGEVQKMPLMRQAAPLTMGWCLNCHRDPKPYLRPRDKIFNMTWKPPKDQAAQGREAARRLSHQHRAPDRLLAMPPMTRSRI